MSTPEPRIALETTEPAMIRGASFAAQTAQALLTRLTSADFAVGERLPGERTLAQELGVGRSAVREALAALEILGIVEIRPGSGTYLRDTTSELLPRTLQWGILLNADRIDELLSVRRALEIHAVRLATDRFSPDHERALRQALEAQERTLGEEAFVEADLRFHVALADAAENATLMELLGTIRALLRIWMEHHIQDREQMRTAFLEHRQILEAMARGDADTAVARMNRHMDTADARLRAAARG